MVARGASLNYCLPKVESHLDEALWNDIFVTTERRLRMPFF